MMINFFQRARCSNETACQQKGKNSQQDAYFALNRRKESNSALTIAQYYMMAAIKIARENAKDDAGSTCLISVARKNEIAIAYLGDSPAFLVSKNKTNHQVMIRPLIPLERLHRNNEKLSRRLGRCENEPDFVHLKADLLPDNCTHTIILASDGLQVGIGEAHLLQTIGQLFYSNKVQPLQICKSVMAKSGNPILSLAPDNITIVLSDLPSESDAVHIRGVFDGHHRYGDELSKIVATELYKLPGTGNIHTIAPVAENTLIQPGKIVDVLPSLNPIADLCRNFTRRLGRKQMAPPPKLARRQPDYHSPHQ